MIAHHQVHDPVRRTRQSGYSTCLAGYVPVTGLTGSTGTVRLPDSITLSATTTIFGNLGNANTARTYTVTDSVSGRTLSVTVAASGRVTIGP
jgi:hypothetical protein